MDYNEFRKQYENQHRASVPVIEATINEYPQWLRIPVLLMFMSAALLSGVHTVPTVRQGIEQGGAISDFVRDAVSLGSFVAVELAIFVSAYMMMRGNRLFTWSILGIAFLVAMVANIYSISKAYSTNASAWVIAVSLTLGIGAPLIALMAGKMFVNMHRSDRYAAIKAQERYQEAMVKFDAAVLSAFKRETSASVRSRGKMDRMDSVSASEQRTGEHNTGQDYTKKMDARDIVSDYLRDNPDAFDLSVRQLAGLLDVSKSTVAEVMRTMRSGQNSNGHHREEDTE